MKTAAASPEPPEPQNVQSRPRMIFQEDDSPTPSPARPASTHLPYASKETESMESSMPQQMALDGELSSESSSDGEARRPMGRAARRMISGDDSAKFSPVSKAQFSTRPNIRAIVESDDELYAATPRRSSPHHEATSPSPPTSEPRFTLFVSPARPSQEESEDELPQRPFDDNSRLAALVAGKRAERLAKEAQEEERRKRRSISVDAASEDDQEPANADIERIMSDAAKPTRKASKKAMLEMERETQRMSRQKALTHQMQVKKKFTTSDLFARFNFHTTGQVNEPTPVHTTHSGSSAPNSDGLESVGREPVSTPPSTPPTPYERQKALVEKGALGKLIPVRQESLASLVDDDDNGKILTVTDYTTFDQVPATVNARPLETDSIPKKGLKLARLGKNAMLPHHDSSDDELEIIQKKPSRLKVLDNAKGISKRQHTDSTAIHVLKHLSHLGTATATVRQGKKGTFRPSVNLQVLESQLRMRAKQHAREQQAERIAELRAKGIQVQTTEEREQEQEAFDNLLEKAKQDAVELRKAEKAAARVDGEGKASISADESEDESYVTASGSEDEDVTEIDNGTIDDAADESEGEEEHIQEDELNESDQPTDDEMKLDAPDPTAGERRTLPSVLETPINGRKPRKSRVIVDDEDEDETIANPSYINTTFSGAVAADDSMGDDDPFAAFGFGAEPEGSPLMSPTQAFKATMQTPTQATQGGESLDFLRHLVPPCSSSLPAVFLDMEMETQNHSQSSCIPGSQVPESQQVNLQWETQAPETPVPGMNRANSNVTLETPGWMPTQDGGLPSPFQAMPDLQGRDGLYTDTENDTQSTVRLRVSVSPAPEIMPNRKFLVRGQRARIVSSNDEEGAGGSDLPAKRNAFREMARKRKEALTAAEWEEAEREAKGMMDEQAEESEDEYTGLGGDDYIAPENEQDRAMIDSSLIDVNERELAAHFAERQRVEDEAAASKLYKDIMTGALRRKQANMFDLDEDEDDIAARRRQMRQREEARKRKLLLQDDNIAGLAEGKQSKGKDAFLKAIADDDEHDDEALDLSDVEEEEIQATQTDSQPSQQLTSQEKPLREVSGNKRRLEDASMGRPPAKQRRTKPSAFRAPASMLELKESVSFLLDEPHAHTIELAAHERHSDSENEDQGSEYTEEEDNDDDEALREEIDRQNDGGFAPDKISMPPPRLPASQRRTAPEPTVVDRLLLKRGSSSSETSAHGRTAWAAPANGGFKVPSLLRRATTNTALGANDRGVTTSTGLSRENSSGLKMGGTKNSSLAAQARAEERKAIVEASVKRRAENTARIAQLRRASSSGFGKGLGGRFE